AFEGAFMHFALLVAIATVSAVPVGTARLDSAEVYYASGNYAAVVRLLNAPDATRPREKLLLGWSQYRLGQMQEASASFEAGLAQAPESVDLINGHAFALYRLGDAS